MATEELINRVEELDELLERFLETSLLTYDSEFHKYIIDEINDLRNEVNKLKDEVDKTVILSIINERVKVTRDELLEQLGYEM